MFSHSSPRCIFISLILAEYTCAHIWNLHIFLFKLFNEKYELVKWVLSLPMAGETRVQSQIESYERLKKWYLIPSCLTLSIIRYVSRVKWSNPGKGVAPSTTPQCSSYWKGSLQVTFDDCRQLNFFICSSPNRNKSLTYTGCPESHFGI